MAPKLELFLLLSEHFYQRINDHQNLKFCYIKATFKIHTTLMRMASSEYPGRPPGLTAGARQLDGGAGRVHLKAPMGCLVSLWGSATSRDFYCCCPCHLGDCISGFGPRAGHWAVGLIDGRNFMPKIKLES